LLRDRLNLLQEELSFNGEIINKLNDYYLPYYQNFDRFDD
jgi:DNA-dependent RNA polymerase auxiliary subunit epsilon